jgi:hypothetical protein
VKNEGRFSFGASTDPNTSSPPAAELPLKGKPLSKCLLLEEKVAGELASLTDVVEKIRFRGTFCRAAPSYL